jgi:hypothetical protein
MKQCFKCKNEFPLDFFKWRNKAKGVKFSYCNDCMIGYRREHYLTHKDYYLDKAHTRNRRVKRERTKFLLNYLLSHPCVDCGNTNPVVLEFDHKDEKMKEFNVGSVLYWGSTSRILKEIQKCEVRCSNCHKIKTANQRHWLKASIN